MDEWRDVSSWRRCQQACQSSEGCGSWAYFQDDYSGDVGSVGSRLDSEVPGEKTCPPPNPGCVL